MTSQRRRPEAWLHAVRGLAVLLFAGTCLALVAPTAGASPIGDADNSITAAWKDAGGDTSDLGPKQGDCYATGSGFAQDFVHGKMFFTPDTGPRSMMGAILDKYESLGGPAASDLGFPVTSEVRGLAGPDSRVSTFSASDKPLIYWTADHGAFVVRGAINAAWDKLGSSGGALGVPVGDETYDGELTTQAFNGGKVSWNRLTKSFTTVPPDLAGQLTGLQIPVDPTAAINMAWRAAGGAAGPLGAKQGDQYAIGDDDLAQNFAGGKVFYSPATGANAVESDILAKYEALGGPAKSDLGFPISNEADGGVKPASKVSAFSAADKPVIFWTADHGAFVVRGAIRAAWDKLLGATGKLGAPVADAITADHVVTQKFAGGQIAWNKADNTFSTQPANLASALSGLQVPGEKAPANSASSPKAATGWLSGHRWWLLAGVGALVLLGLLALLARYLRRSRSSDRDDDIDDPADELRTESVPQWSSTAARGEGSTIPAEDPRPRPRTVRLPSQPSSEWMPPSHQSLVDELLADDETDVHPKVASSHRFDEPDHDDFGDDPEFGHDDEFRSEDDHGEHFAADDDFGRRGERFTGGEEFGHGLDDDTDHIDTDPTGMPALGDVRGGRHAAADVDGDAVATEAVPVPRIARGQLAIHLPMDDPYQVPDGYPVKANASSGLYYMPDSALYDDTQAEIWFASEGVAKANGFHRAG